MQADLEKAPHSSPVDEKDEKATEFTDVKLVASLSEDGSEVRSKGNYEDDQARALAGDERRIFTEEESEAVKRKMDRLIIPILCAVYFSQFLDKTALKYVPADFPLRQA